MWITELEGPDLYPHTYEHLIFDKEAKNVQWTKESIFNKCCWHNWMAALWKNANKSISIALHKIQVQVDQRPQHKSSYTKTDRRETGK